MLSDHFSLPELIPSERPWRALLLQPAELTVLPCDSHHLDQLASHPAIGPMLRKWRAIEPDGDHYLLPLTGVMGRMILIGLWPKSPLSGFEALKRAASWLRRLDPLIFQSAQISFELISLATREQVADACLSSWFARQAILPAYKQTHRPRPELTLEISHLPDSLSLQRMLAEARGNALARYLSILPGSELDPGRYLEGLQQLAGQYQWQLHHYSLDTLRQLGAGAFCAVAQGYPEPHQGIVRLQYHPDDARLHLALVGKGICFDTGGYNLKGSSHLYAMHQDMAGSATALGCLLAIQQSGLPVAVDCWLAIAENHISPAAFKPNDLITALNGITIEVVDTDAEGRMVLADALTLASREKPDLLIDYATLTGSCVRAIGRGYAGAFSNQPQWFGELISTGEACGERIWPFPLPEDYLAHLSSDVADIKQCANETSTDHIDAALFLRKFVEQDTRWIHLDLAAAKHAGGLGHITSDCTGFGVRFTLAWLQRLLAGNQRTD